MRVFHPAPPGWYPYLFEGQVLGGNKLFVIHYEDHSPRPYLLSIGG